MDGEEYQVVWNFKHPCIKDQLLLKLDLKIQDYDTELRRKLSLLEDQMQRISTLCDPCTTSRSETEFMDYIKVKSVQLSTAELVEFVYDIDQVYTTARHQMLNFLKQRQKSETEFFSLSGFEQILQHYFLI